MAQTLSRAIFPRGTRNPRQNIALSQLSRSILKKVFQAVLTLSSLAAVLWVSVESNMYVSEIVSASIIIALITFVRLIGQRN